MIACNCQWIFIVKMLDIFFFLVLNIIFPFSIQMLLSKGIPYFITALVTWFSFGAIIKGRFSHFEVAQAWIKKTDVFSPTDVSKGDAHLK